MAGLSPPSAHGIELPVSRIHTYASFVRFSHSVFALPFALTGALLALSRTGSGVSAVMSRVAWIVVAMVAARSAAMGFNRLVDAAHDALNPRTAMREIPRGAMSRTEAAVFITVSRCVFVFAAWRLGPVCFALSPVALAIVFWYSLAKRVTNYTQLFLGLAMAVAPVGGWLAAGGGRGAEPWLLGLAIGTWVGGFDVLYACQDLDFDRAHGLRSIPVRFGVARSLAISRALHVDHRPLPAVARRRRGARLAVYWPASPVWRDCWSSSSRSCRNTICRRSSAPSTSMAMSASCIS